MTRILLILMSSLSLLTAGDAPTNPPMPTPTGTAPAASPAEQPRELPPLPELPERCRRNAAAGLDAGWDRACKGMGKCFRWGWRNGNGAGSTSEECERARDGQRCLRGQGNGPGSGGGNGGARRGGPAAPGGATP